MMFNIDINKDKKKTHQALPTNKIATRDFVTVNYDPYDLQTKVTPKIEYLDCAGDSINLPEIEFSNMLPSIEQQAVDSYIEIGLEKLEVDPTLLLSSNSPIRYSGTHKNRIKTILSAYLSEEEFNQCCDYFRKSDVNTEALLGNRGAFRVISVYLVEPKKDKRQRHSKHCLKVILLDPYHLFIPSRYKDLTAEEYRRQVYSEVSHFTEHVKGLFNAFRKETKLEI